MMNPHESESGIQTHFLSAFASKFVRAVVWRNDSLRVASGFDLEIVGTIAI